MEKNTLNGFEAVFDLLNPNVGDKSDKNIVDNVSESLTDEELEEIRKQQNKKTEDEEKEEEELEEKEEDTKKENKKKEKEEKEDGDDGSKDNDPDPDDNDTITGNEEEIITGFFDSLAEKLGWEDVEDDDKPRTAEDLIDYFKEVIEENSVPQYASDEVEALDKFVKNGGNLRDYFTIEGEIDLENIDIEDEINQKIIVRELLKEKGYSTKQIDKKVAKYEDAGILEDEATDALEALKDIKAKQKEELLTKQQKAAEEAKKQQQEFFNNVVTEIKGMDSIYGIEIPEKDKRQLLEYIFKPDANGITKYQKDYAKSLKNLITSAYFTMKGDDLISTAKKKGKRDALDSFKQSLTRNSGVNKKSKKQVINTDDDMSIWDTFARKIRVS